VVESDGSNSDWSGRGGGEEVDQLVAEEKGRDKKRARSGRARRREDAKASRDGNAEERKGGLTNGAIDRGSSLGKVRILLLERR